MGGNAENGRAGRLPIPGELHKISSHAQQEEFPHPDACPGVPGGAPLAGKVIARQVSESRVGCPSAAVLRAADEAL